MMHVPNPNPKGAPALQSCPKPINAGTFQGAVYAHMVSEHTHFNFYGPPMVQGVLFKSMGLKTTFLALREPNSNVWTPYRRGLEPSQNGMPKIDDSTLRCLKVDFEQTRKDLG